MYINSEASDFVDAACETDMPGPPASRDVDVEATQLHFIILKFVKTALI